MAKTCCVDGCLPKDDIFFRFPNSRTLCKKWMDAVRLTTKPGHNSVLCSAHFHPEDYALVRGKVRLKPKVIPTLHKVEQSKTNKTLPNNINRSDRDENESAGESTLEEEDRVKKNEDVPNDRIENKNSNENHDDTNDKKEENRKYALRKNRANGEIEKGISSRERRKNRSEKVKNVTNKRKKGRKPAESVTQVVKPPAEVTPGREDIEEFLTYFHIKQNKSVAERQHAELERERKRNGEGEVIDLAAQETESQPVFIEVSVDKDGGEGRGSGGSRDCLMVMESVQVELDPNDLMLPEAEEGDEGAIIINDKAEEAISLLTSSDEDDVIFQEPQIDTVVVSDEEAPTRPPLLVCDVCGRSTASEAQLRVHRDRHRAERRRRKRLERCARNHSLQSL